MILINDWFNCCFFIVFKVLIFLFNKILWYFFVVKWEIWIGNIWIFNCEIIVFVLYYLVNVFLIFVIIKDWGECNNIFGFINIKVFVCGKMLYCFIVLFFWYIIFNGVYGV